MLRLHREDRFALLTIPLSTTVCLETMGTGRRNGVREIRIAAYRNGNSC